MLTSHLHYLNLYKIVVKLLQITMGKKIFDILSLLWHERWNYTANFLMKSVCCDRAVTMWWLVFQLLQSGCLWQDSHFLASTQQVTALCMCVCFIVCVCDCIMVIHKPHMQIMQHMHVHKAVNGGVEAKKLPSRQRHPIVCSCFLQKQCIFCATTKI